MSEEVQDPQGGSPDPEAVSATNWDSDDNPWKKRFEDYRPEADRRATRLSQFEQAQQNLTSDDAEERRQAAEFFGVELAEDEPIDNGGDPYDELRREMDSKLSERDRKYEQQRQQDLAAMEVERRLSALKLSDEPGEPDENGKPGYSEKDWVLARAVQLPGEDGLPDIAKAHAELQGLQKALERKWAKSKTAPRSIQPGATATQQKNLVDMTPEERVDYMTQLAEDRAAANAASA